ncbi:MAG TPA: glycosyltransferase family 4 protein [Candidatus Polarisedimenticolia bacterium]|nr:glycosyltransferase family 4 protein [Candidatus Polarisedimenticolia bacterium]
MKLKLLIYTHSWAPAIGGVETVTAALAEGMAKSDRTCGGNPIAVQLVTRAPAADNQSDSPLAFEVIRRPSLGKFIRLFRSADIIHLAGPALLPMALAWLFNKRTVLEHHNYQSICPNGLLILQPDWNICPGHYMAGHYRKCIECNSNGHGRMKSVRDLLLMFPRRWLAKRVTVNVAPSCHMQHRAALPRTQVIYHGVAQAGASSVSSGGYAARPACFAFVGRLVKEKGVSVLLRAAHQVLQKGHDFRLKIVGDGPERASLESLAAELGLAHVTEFTGPMPMACLSTLLADSAAVVMPSTWEDVAPLVALEQMMQGRLLIVSDIGGLGETVDEFGLKFPAGDATALASCMLRVLRDPGFVEALKANAQRHASEAYTEQRMVEDHLRLYYELMKRI